MPLDGMFMRCLCDELKQAQGSRIEKIYQPSHDEFVFCMRGKNLSKKLLITVSGAAPRIHFTNLEFENPAVPPTLCMLVRKHFQSARLDDIKQLGLDRTLTLTFSGFNEMGDEVRLEIVVEIMGRQSNIVFLSDGRIIDAVRRVDPEKSSRLILPGARYEYPELRNKADILNCDIKELCGIINSQSGNLSKLITENVEGVSPLVARELVYEMGQDTDLLCPLDAELLKGLETQLKRLRQNLSAPKPYLVGDKEYSFMPVNQYGIENVVKDSFSGLLDSFYKERTLNDSMKRKAHDLNKLVTSLIERTTRKIEKQRGELAQCADKEQLRINGELIKANLYRIERGVPYCEVEDYYQTPPQKVRIKLKPELSAAANAQRYFKEYKKAHVAEDMLKKLIEQGAQELDYLDSLSDSIARATSDKELAQIRLELFEQGYIRLPKGSYRAPKALPAMKYEKDGFEIRVGRNNRQNDVLTLKESFKSDIWLHTKNVHGSHVIISTKGQDVPDDVIIYAAQLAAYHSKARLSSQVAVDYCPVKNVKKPTGAKPGMVIYENYNTVYVTPKEKE